MPTPTWTLDVLPFWVYTLQIYGTLPPKREDIQGPGKTQSTGSRVEPGAPSESVYVPSVSSTYAVTSASLSATDAKQLRVRARLLQGLGRVQVLGFRVWGLGFRGQGISTFRVSSC